MRQRCHHYGGIGFARVGVMNDVGADVVVAASVVDKMGIAKYAGLFREIQGWKLL